MVALGKPDRNREAELRQAIGIRSMSAKSSDPLVSIHSSSTGMLRIIQRPLLAHSIVCFRRLPALSGSNVSTGCFHTCDTKDRDDAVNDGNYGDTDEEHIDMDDGSNRSTSSKKYE